MIRISNNIKLKCKVCICNLTLAMTLILYLRWHVYSTLSCATVADHTNQNKLIQNKHAFKVGSSAQMIKTNMVATTCDRTLHLRNCGMIGTNWQNLSVTLMLGQVSCFCKQVNRLQDTDRKWSSARYSGIVKGRWSAMFLAFPDTFIKSVNWHLMLNKVLYNSYMFICIKW